MPLKTKASQLKAVHNYYTKNVESIKIRKANYYKANRTKLLNEKKEYYIQKKLQPTVPIIA